MPAALDRILTSGVIAATAAAPCGPRVVDIATVSLHGMAAWHRDRDVYQAVNWNLGSQHANALHYGSTCNLDVISKVTEYKYKYQLKKLLRYKWKYLVNLLLRYK